MWILRMRYEMMTNYCSTELKNWTREPKRWENLGKGMIGVLAKLPMRNNCQPEFVRLFASAPSDL